MSDVIDKRERWGRDFAIEVGKEIMGFLEPVALRMEIAGSVRRGVKMVKDIEILYVPAIRTRQKPGDMFATEEHNYADDTLIELEQNGTIARRPNIDGRTSYGPKNKFMVYAKGDLRIPIDFFACPLENWWVSLVIRTGPKELCLKLTTGAQKQGLTLNAYGPGVTRLRDGLVTPATSEEHVFQLCGIKYLEPHERH